MSGILSGMEPVDFDAYDGAVLLATPATLLDRDTHLTSAFEIMGEVPKYAIGKKLTSADAAKILHASLQHLPNRRYDGPRDHWGKPWEGDGPRYYYFVDDPKFGDIRVVVKPTTVHVEAWNRRAKDGYKQVVAAERVTWAAYSILEKVARRRKFEELEHAVLGAETVRETAKSSRDRKKEDRALNEKIKTLAKQTAYAAVPRETLRYAALLEKGSLRTRDDDIDSNTLSMKITGRWNDAESALRKKFFRSIDVPAPESVYDLDHPPVQRVTGLPPFSIVLDDVWVKFQMNEITVSDRGQGAGHTFFKLWSSTGLLRPKMGWATRFPSRRVFEVILQMLQAYGLDHIDLIDANSNVKYPMIEAGFREIEDAPDQLEVPRKNPRRGRR